MAQSGKVLDKDGEPQVGCKVTAPDLGLITYTDFDGKSNKILATCLPCCRFAEIRFI